MDKYVDVFGLNFTLDELRSKNVEEVEQIVGSIKRINLISGSCFRVLTEGDLSILRGSDSYSIHYLTDKQEKFYFSLAGIASTLFIPGTYVIKALDSRKKVTFITTMDSEIAEFIVLAIKRNHESIEDTEGVDHNGVNIVHFTPNGFTVSENATSENEQSTEDTCTLQSIINAIKVASNPSNDNNQKKDKKQSSVDVHNMTWAEYQAKLEANERKRKSKECKEQHKTVTLEEFLKSHGVNIQ